MTDWRTQYRERNIRLYDNPRNAFQRGYNDYYGRPASDRLSMETSNRLRYHASGVPILGDFIRADDSQHALEDYMKNTGLTWADVKYPSRVMGAGQMASAVAGVGSSALGGVMYSRILRMYR